MSQNTAPKNHNAQRPDLSTEDIDYCDQQRVAHLAAAYAVLSDDTLGNIDRLVINAAHLQAAAAHQIAIATADQDQADEAWNLTMLAAEIDGSA